MFPVPWRLFRSYGADGQNGQDDYKHLAPNGAQATEFS